MQIISAPSGIKGVQRGISSIAGGVSVINPAISLVNMSKSTLNFSVGSNGATGLAAMSIRGSISSGNELMFSRSDSTGGATVSWEVTEYA